MRGHPRRQPVKQAGNRIQSGQKRGEQGIASTAGIPSIVRDGGMDEMRQVVQN